MRALKKRGFEVFAIAPQDEYTEFLREEFSCLPLKNLDRKGKNPVKDLKLLGEYFYYYRNLKPNFVINYTVKPNIYSSFACGVLGIPCISVLTGLGYVYQRGGFLKFLVSWLYGLSLRLSKKVVFMNPDDFKELKKILPEDKLTLIKSSGVNTQYFSPDICEEHYYEKLQGKTVFLFLGRFLKDKGIFELVEASRKLWNDRKDFEVWLVGDLDKDNPESIHEADLKKIEEMKFIKIYHFTKDVRRFLCYSTVVVYPSYREGFPRAVLEAMAMEKPVITTDVPGCRETVFEERNGFLVEPKNVESLYKAMKRFMNLKEEEIKRMGKEGRNLVIEFFDERVVIAKYIELIESILKH